MRRVWLSLVVAMMLGGCATAKFSCSKPGSPGCKSVADVYREGKAHARAREESPEGWPETIRPGDPLRSGERVLRVWVAPWVDADGDFHDQSYVYLVVDHGRWIVERERERIERIRPRVLPPEPKPKRSAPEEGAR